MNVLVIGNGFDIQHGINISFKDFVESNQFKIQMKNYIAFFNDENYKEYSEKFSFKTELWSDFEDYLGYLYEKVGKNKKTFIKKINSAFSMWIENMDIPTPEKDEYIEKNVFSNDIHLVISLNYTETPKIYGYERIPLDEKIKKSELKLSNIKNKFINIHNFDRKEYKHIIGNDLHEKMRKKNVLNYGWSGKKTNLFFKEETLPQMLSSDEVENIFIYGYSFGDSDSDLNKMFMNKIIKRKLTIFSYKERQTFLKMKRGFKKIIIIS